jgi:hypothetical protein
MKSIKMNKIFVCFNAETITWRSCRYWRFRPTDRTNRDGTCIFVFFGIGGKEEPTEPGSENYKLQIPNYKQIPNHKSEIPNKYLRAWENRSPQNTQKDTEKRWSGGVLE